MTKTPIVKGLGEVALRVNDLHRMKRFYQEVLGLNELGDFPGGALLKIASGNSGYTQVLGLFDRSASVAQPQTTLNHLAFEIDLIDYEAETRLLQGLALDVTVREHNWIKWRSFHDTPDLEQNAELRILFRCSPTPDFGPVEALVFGERSSK